MGSIFTTIAGTSDGNQPTGCPSRQHRKDKTMTNETEYQRGYREGAEKMREEIKDVILLIAKNTKPYSKEVAEYLNILAGNVPSIPLPITPPQPEARDDKREMREAFEKWFRDNGWCDPSTGDNKQLALSAWQAAYAAGVRDGAPQWQDISSAPKDGSVFQAMFLQDWDESQLDGEHSGWLHLPRLPFNCKWVENYFEDEPEDESGAFVEVDKCGMGDDDVEPAYWMPLPEAPKGGV
jgi:hypothetical protein